MIRIIIPAYNEAANLPGIIEDIAVALAAGSYHITVVNDGSKDATGSLLNGLAARYPLTTLTHPVNRGVAAAFRTGFQAVLTDAADNDVVVFMEGDGTSPPALIPLLASRIERGADLVIASRYQPGGGYTQFPVKRLILSYGANLVFRLLFPIRGVRDYSIFYRAYRVPPLRAAMAEHQDAFITVETFFANLEVLLKLRPYLRRVDEIPLRYDYGKKKGKSGMKVWKNLRSYLTFIARHGFRYGHHKH